MAEVARGYSWEPFRDGNEAGLRHGAYSERRIAPLAAEVEQQARALPTWPSYLDEPVYAPAVRAWARAEAVVELLWTYLAERDLDAALASTTESTTEAEESRGSSRSRTSTRATESALSMLDRAEARAAKARQRLGLDPLSRARLGRDVTAARTDLAQMLTAEQERLDAAQAAPGPTHQPTPDRPSTGDTAPRPHTSGDHQ
ncbi:hypothetical protein [Pseudonocardia parietis]|uniref:PPE family protein n=1 Tax=Pseudonocardia parietis TaxID=570936 RepID=A0ABS4W3G4_9PSEU|nr:hypothetical protein [Pseudonocardia parietis]MBP2370690.1 hypothetical protein [Pseudonocardia parietis]